LLKATCDTIVDGGNIGVWDMDLRKNLVWRSPTHDEIYGYREAIDDWSFEVFMEHVRPDDWQQMSDFFDRSSR